MDIIPVATNKNQNKNPPGKYIRTLAGDIKTLKEGGTPDFAPFTPSGDSPKDTFFAIPPIAARVPPPTPLPTPVPPPVVIPVQKSIPEPLRAPSIAPPEPVSVSAAPLKTYEGDFLQRIQDTHSSAATVLAAEQDSAVGDPQVTPQKSSHQGLIFGITGSLLLMISGVGIYIAYTKYLDKTQVIFAPVVSAPIFVDEREQLSSTGLGLSQEIEQSVARMIEIGAVRLLYLETSTSTAPLSVFSALRLSAPDILLRNVNVAGSMAGVAHIDGKQSPFFILSVDSYSDTFSGMLQWEATMPKELAKLFPPHAKPTAPVLVATSTVGTPKKNMGGSSTSTPSVLEVPSAFFDDVVANHDVRIYRDAAGQSSILYGYWNQTTLVIARDPAAFTEILQRLATSRAQ